MSTASQSRLEKIAKAALEAEAEDQPKRYRAVGSNPNVHAWPPRPKKGDEPALGVQLLGL